MHQKGPSEVISEGPFELAWERMGRGNLDKSPGFGPLSHGRRWHAPVDIGASIPIRNPRSSSTTSSPIAQLYEQSLVHHVGAHVALEDQMVTWVVGMDSPDRMDAAVHGLTELADPDQLAAVMRPHPR